MAGRGEGSRTTRHHTCGGCCRGWRMSPRGWPSRAGGRASERVGGRAGTWAGSQVGARARGRAGSRACERVRMAGKHMRRGGSCGTKSRTTGVSLFCIGQFPRSGKWATCGPLRLHTNAVAPAQSTRGIEPPPRSGGPHAADAPKPPPHTWTTGLTRNCSVTDLILIVAVDRTHSDLVRRIADARA